MACCQGLVCDSQVIRNNPFFPHSCVVSFADPPNTLWTATSLWFSGCSLLCWKYLKLLLMFCCCMLPNFCCGCFGIWFKVLISPGGGGKSPFRKSASVPRSCSQWQRSYTGAIKVLGMRLLQIILLAWFWGHGNKLQKHLQSIGTPGILIQKLAEVYLDIRTETRGLSMLSLLPFSCYCCWFFGNVVLSPFCPSLFLIFRCRLCALQMGMWKNGKVLPAACKGPTCVVFDFWLLQSICV